MPIKEVESPFERNTLPDMNVVPVNYSELFHSEPISLQGSVFQGHVKSISSLEDAVQARDALFQEPSVASASHIMYAYRISNDDGTFLQGNSDDGEYRGSSILLEQIEGKMMKDVFLAVSRVHKGPNLGKKRFKLIEQACIDVLNLKDENTFN